GPLAKLTLQEATRMVFFRGGKDNRPRTTRSPPQIPPSGGRVQISGVSPACVFGPQIQLPSDDPGENDHQLPPAFGGIKLPGRQAVHLLAQRPQARPELVALRLS